MEPAVPAATDRSRRSPYRVVGWLLAAAWAAAVVAGFAELFRHAGEPGAAVLAPPQWPASAPFARDAARPTLVLFAHPHCPCTRASLHELDRIVTRCGDRAAAVVAFYADEAAGPAWAETDTWDFAGRIEGVRREVDAGGRAARVFGAATSGSVLLYAATGELLFQGGITGSRGHEGESEGSTAVVQHVLGTGTSSSSAAVYGCCLHGRDEHR